MLSSVVARSFPLVPRQIVRRMAARYISGTTLVEALEVVEELNRTGRLGAMTVLGENVADSARVDATVDDYRAVLDAIGDNELGAYISVKPSSLGLQIDHSLALDSYRTLARQAAAHATFVRIEMEDAATTDDTLGLYRELRAEGIDNVGIVLQASMRRTLDDIRDLAPLQPSVRLCKGIYVESGVVQHHDFDVVRANFLRCADELLAGGSYLAAASHDEHLIEGIVQRVEQLGVAAERYEFQMLRGVRGDLGAELVASGHRLRLAVVFGSHWYEYARRRFRENPKLASDFARDLAKRALQLPARRP
jgi:proline dehydrogenase